MRARGVISLHTAKVASILCLLLSSVGVIVPAAFGWAPAGAPCLSRSRRKWCATELYEKNKPAGSFFNPVPDPEDGPNSSSSSSSSGNKDDDDDDIDMEDQFRRFIERRKTSKATQPSTINGIPSARASGFEKSQNKKKNTPSSSSNQKPFVAVGPRSLNDPTRPEYDDQGYTLYVDEETGEKSRVFEALVDYPCRFTLKIIGANQGDFVREMLLLTSECCQVSVDALDHSVRAVGKWTSVTIQAPVDSAEMLYLLYETVDRDPRVKFKF
jgi:putative lipoic acid-binding regulatory protein